MIRNVLFLDTETTGLSPPEHEVIEVGAVLWNLKSRSILESHSALMQRTPPDRGNPAEPFNGIRSDALDEATTDRETPWTIVEHMASRADMVLAHSADFDKKFVEAARQGEVEHLLRVPWVCTLEDVDWPMTSRHELGRAGSGSLLRLALAHGVAVTNAHRAIHDCLLLVRLCEIVDDVDVRLRDALERSKRPKATFVALVDRDMNDTIKALGFHWKREANPGYWWRRMAIEDAEKLPFEVAYEEQYLDLEQRGAAS